MNIFPVWMGSWETQLWERSSSPMTMIWERLQWRGEESENGWKVNSGAKCSLIYAAVTQEWCINKSVRMTALQLTPVATNERFKFWEIEVSSHSSAYALLLLWNPRLQSLSASHGVVDKIASNDLLRGWGGGTQWRGGIQNISTVTGMPYINLQKLWIYLNSTVWRQEERFLRHWELLSTSPTPVRFQRSRVLTHDWFSDSKTNNALGYCKSRCNLVKLDSHSFHGAPLLSDRLYVSQTMGDCWLSQQRHFLSYTSACHLYESLLCWSVMLVLPLSSTLQAMKHNNLERREGPGAG